VVGVLEYLDQEMDQLLLHFNLLESLIQILDRVKLRNQRDEIFLMLSKNKILKMKDNKRRVSLKEDNIFKHNIMIKITLQIQW
jgi:hypothetical protein